MSELRVPELNRVVPSGRFTRDPDRRYASDGTAHAEQWSLEGRRLATIPLIVHASSIAVDPADGTLWVLRDAMDDASCLLTAASWFSI